MVGLTLAAALRAGAAPPTADEILMAAERQRGLPRQAGLERQAMNAGGIRDGERRQDVGIDPWGRNSDQDQTSPDGDHHGCRETPP